METKRLLNLCLAFGHRVQRIPIRALVHQRAKQAALFLQQRFRRVELDKTARVEHEL